MVMVCGNCDYNFVDFVYKIYSIARRSSPASKQEEAFARNIPFHSEVYQSEKV